MLARLKLLAAPRAVLELRTVSSLLSRSADVGRGAVMDLEAPV